MIDEDSAMELLIKYLKKQAREIDSIVTNKKDSLGKIHDFQQDIS